MQPYFFPYIGYWRLIQSVDRFVVYNDVDFIKGGWINRNRIMINGEPRYLTIPLQGASANKKIFEISLQPSEKWRKKMLKTLQNTYQRSPFFTETYAMCEEILGFESINLSDFLGNQLNVIVKRIGIDTSIQHASSKYGNDHLHGQTRVIDICVREGATTYVNPPGGESLYESGAFSDNHIQLRFINSSPVKYTQKSSEFVPNLSIIELLMELGFEGVKSYINEYTLYRKI